MHKMTVYSAVALPSLPAGWLKPLPQGKKIMLVSPHSDDISVACGAIISALAPLNTIQPVLFFSGFRGVAGENKAKAIKIREREMAEESRILGVKKPLCLGLASYDKESPLSKKKDWRRVREIIEREQPQIIFLPKKDDFHPRHKLAANLFLKALRRLDAALTGQLFFYENPWSAIGPFEFNTIFVFSEKELRKQLSAIRAHQSQLKRTAFDKAAQSLAEFRGAVVPEQRLFGYGKGGNHFFKGAYIEAFLVNQFSLPKK